MEDTRNTFPVEETSEVTYTMGYRVGVRSVKDRVKRISKKVVTRIVVDCKNYDIIDITRKNRKKILYPRYSFYKRRQKTDNTKIIEINTNRVITGICL